MDSRVSRRLVDERDERKRRLKGRGASANLAARHVDVVTCDMRYTVAKSGSVFASAFLLVKTVSLVNVLSRSANGQYVSLACVGTDASHAICRNVMNNWCSWMR